MKCHLKKTLDSDDYMDEYDKLMDELLSINIENPITVERYNEIMIELTRRPRIQLDEYERYTNMVTGLIERLNDGRITTEQYCEVILRLIEAYRDVTEREFNIRRRTHNRYHK